MHYIVSKLNQITTLAMNNRTLRLLKYMLIVSPAFVLFSFIRPVKNITIYLAGDSTAADKEVRYYPETGWGMPFKVFFDHTVTVKNIAKNGRSTQSFINEGLWKSITDQLAADDYVLIQFGHNDEVPTKKTYTTETQFAANLTRFVADVRAKGAIPLLLTPVARRKFDQTGKVEGTHEIYSAIVRRVAGEMRVPLLDLDRDSQLLLQKMGPENSRLLYNHLGVGEHPNYPLGKADDTHFNELGARMMAQIVLSEIRLLKLDLADRVVQPATP